MFLDSLTVFVVQDFYASNKDKLEMASARESLARNDCRASADREQTALHVQSETTRKSKYATREFYYDRVEQ